MHKEYEGKKRGDEIIAHITEERVSLDIHQPKIGIPKATWVKDGWELTPLTNPTVSKNI